MKIDEERLRIGIENSTEVELNIDELIASAKILDGEYIFVSNKNLEMTFNDHYEMVECAGNEITENYEINECGVDK